MRATIRIKLMASYLALIVLAIILIVFILVQMTSLYQVVTYINSNIVPSVSSMDQIQIKVNYYRRQQLQHIVATDAADMATREQNLTTTMTDLEALIKKYQADMISDETDRKNIAAIDSAWQTYKSSDDAILAFSKQNKKAEALATLNSDEITAKFNALESALATGSQYNQQLAEEKSVASKNTYNNAILWSIVLTLVAVITALALGFWISNSFSKAARMMADTARKITQDDIPALSRAGEAIAAGDLTQPVRIQSQKINFHSSDELGDLAEAFNDMISQMQNMGTTFETMTAGLRDLIGQVTQNARNLSSASSQLASSAMQAGQATNQIATTIQQVAKGITQQTEAVNKTALSAEQMGRAIDGVAKGAQEQSNSVTHVSNMTVDLSKIIQNVAEQSRQQAEGAALAVSSARASSKSVENTVNGIQMIKTKVDLSSRKVEEMGKHSQEIGVIVETIGDIASQTNLLALNAAIEAARAGEHGKGFAVVADEVRKLAEKSASATKEITNLVHNIQQTVEEAIQAMNESSLEVEKGVSQTTESNQSLDAILQAAGEGQKIGENIMSAAAQMSNMARELVSSMDSVSAVVEENTAATEEMAASSDEVTQAVEAFASISEENSAAVEQVSASTEEMNAQVEEVTASVDSLSQMARQLNELVTRFKLE
jgi:methyl-accepting chemotaxis protein